MAKMAKNDDISIFQEFSLYIKTRTIYIGSENYTSEGEGGIDGLLAERVIKNLAILEGTSNDPITIILNSEGGDYYQALAIYDYIKSLKSHVTIKIIGNCMSAATIISLAADVRVMSPNSTYMIHYGSDNTNGHAKTTQRWSEEYKRNSLWMEQLYLSKIREKHPDFKLSKVKAMLDHDTIMDAKTCLNLGLVDSILE